MIVVRLIGSLGNQMFQYAAARALADRLGVELVLDTCGFDAYKFCTLGLGRMNVRARALRLSSHAFLPGTPNWRASSVGPCRCVTASMSSLFFGYDPGWPTLQDDMHLNGYFQSEKYFAVIREQLLVELQPCKDISPSNRRIAAMAGKGDSVMLRVWRGDYVSKPKPFRHTACAVSTTIGGIAWARERLDQPCFFVFSDDLAWSRENLPLGDDAVFVEGNAEAPEMDIFLIVGVPRAYHRQQLF